MKKCKNDGENIIKHDVLIYYCVHYEDKDGQFHTLYYRRKKALFAACSALLDQGEMFTVHEEVMEFTDRQPPLGA